MRNNCIRLYCDSCHISVHLKNLIKMVNFCIAILIVKMEENMQHFWHIMLYYFMKGKNTTEMQRRFVQCVEKVLWLTDRTCQQWFAKFRAGKCAMIGWPAEVNWDQTETLRTINIVPHGRDSWHTQNIQINKVIGEHKNMCLLQKKLNKPFGQPSNTNVLSRCSMLGKSHTAWKCSELVLLTLCHTY